jgi:hypothetical protein
MKGEKNKHSLAIVLKKSSKDFKIKFITILKGNLFQILFASM